jgi:hypothetical protein
VYAEHELNRLDGLRGDGGKCQKRRRMNGNEESKEFHTEGEEKGELEGFPGVRQVFPHRKLQPLVA